MLLVAGEDAVFGEEGDVAEAVLGAGVVGEEGGWVEEEFDVAEGDQFEAFAVAVVPDGLVVFVGLADEVGAVLLLEAGGHGDEGSDPVGLLVLGGGDALLVVVEEGGDGGLLGGGGDGWGEQCEGKEGAPEGAGGG